MDQQQSFRSILVEWLREIVPFNQFDKYVRKTKESFDAESTDRHANSVTYIFCTDTHTYNVYAHPTYLGAGVSCRKVRAGEDYTRGNDLPDGPFSRETWDNIKAAIIRYEMVKLDIRKSAPVPDSTPPTTRMSNPAPSCGNPACRVEDHGCSEKGKTDWVTIHHIQCPQRGPGWA